MEEVTSKDIVVKQIEQLDKDIKTMKTEHKGSLTKLSNYEQKLKDAFCLSNNTYPSCCKYDSNEVNSCCSLVNLASSLSVLSI